MQPAPPVPMPRTLLGPAALTLLAMLAVWACATTGSTGIDPPVTPDHPGGVHGSVWVQTHEDQQFTGNQLVALRDFEVSLQDKATLATVATATSDVYGRYYLPMLPIGKYVLSWKEQNGWAAGTYGTDIVVEKGTVNPDGLFISAARGHVPIVGKVRLLDGGIPAVVDEYFDVVETPDVSLRDGGGALVGGPVRSNNLAAFALSVERTRIGGGRLRAEIGSISQQDALVAPVAGVVSQDLVLKNKGLQIVALHLKNGAGDEVDGGASGEVLSASAEVVDGDEDPVQVTWKSAFGTTAAALVPAGNDASWTLPGSGGGHALYALVTDGKGAFARAKVAASVDKTVELFDGIVVDKLTGARLKDVEVDVNGSTTNSATNGYWRLEVPVARRYVVNVRHPDYALAGNTFDRGSTGRTWRLVKRQNQVFDPGNGVTLVDERPELDKERRRGARITIRPNTLEGPGGAAPVGNLTASFATLDIGDDEAPGDWAGRGAGGDVGLVSYGVVSIEITDAAGTEYQLSAGATAEVRIPISGVPAGVIPNGAPAHIPIWSYDEADGYWKKSGDANLDVPSSTYVGEVRHFSEINMDQPGDVTCVRVISDPGLLGRYFRASDVAGDGIDYDTVKENVLDKPVNAVYRLPPNQKVQIDVLVEAGGAVLPDVVIERFDEANPQQGWVTLPDHEVLTGPPVGELWPDYPYDDCPITITLKWQEPASVFFLHNKGVGSEAAALSYYDQVNPQAGGAGNRDTLELWWAHNGFNADGSATPGGGEQYARTSYVNGNDLGSGRDMHFFERADGRVAAWVSNYGGFDQNHSNATRALIQNNFGDVVATVCMEYAPMENAGGQFLDTSDNVFVEADFPSNAAYLDAIGDASVVKFFVFADVDGVAGSELRTSANLDGYGDKFVPNLCANCHGGSPLATYSDPSDAGINAFFRELDYHTYDFPLGAPDPSLAEQQSFRVQNDIVRGDDSSLISSSGIKQIIDIWYRGGAADVEQDECIVLGGGSIDGASIPSGWDTNDIDREFYCDVVGRSCRTCHLAFEGFDFTDASDFADGSYIEGRVDTFINNTPDTGTMPHAIITYRNFWLSESPFRPDAAQDFIDNN